jgi:hypothetical protein
MGDGHPPQFFRVLELNVGTFRIHHEPTIIFEPADNFPTFHVCMDTHEIKSPSSQEEKAVSDATFNPAAKLVVAPPLQGCDCDGIQTRLPGRRDR